MAEKKPSKPSRQDEGQALTPWPAFGELEPWSSFFRGWPFARRLPRLLDEVYRDWPWAERARALRPAMDVSEDDARYTISVELPGSRKEDVQVELHEGMLMIRGEKKSQREEKQEQLRYVERCYGSFTRSFRLPPDADAEHLDASFQDGVLTIAIPKKKTEAARSRKIEVR